MIPVRIIRGPEPGPTVFVTGAVHGDELNGTATVLSLIKGGLDEGQLQRGSVLLVPVVNIQGFERKSRYLPDRRDLNRSFPGGATGSGARRLAHTLFTEIVARSDFGVDIHTGSGHRMNFPNIRGDLQDEGVRRIATAFGTEVIIDGSGPKGSLRGAATKAGCPTVVFEGGEIGKAEPGVIAVAERGVLNVLMELGMVDGDIVRPRHQVEARESTWMRSDFGGLLEFHVAPGDIVDEQQPIATCTDLLGVTVGTIRSRVSGVVIGMTTSPTVTPGDPVYHVAVAGRGTDRLRRAIETDEHPRLLDEVRDHLASNVVVSDVEPATGKTRN